MRDELHEVTDRYHATLDAFAKGDPEPAKTIFSQRDDVTLANPFGPVARGWAQVSDAMDRAAGNYRGGEVSRFDTLALHVGSDLAYLVEVEHWRAKLGGRDDYDDVALRVTSIFRREDGQWKMSHRHADPITTARSADSLLER